MTTHASFAQHIHSDVARLIIQFTVHGVMFQNGLFESKKDAVKELLYVSPAWRLAALEFMWKQLNLAIDADADNKIYINSIAWAKKFQLPNNACQMVREINISVPMDSVVSGKARKLLKEYLGDTKSLPLVHKLSVNFANCEIGPRHTIDTSISNTVEFTQLLRSVIQPLTTTTEVKCAGDSWHLSAFAEKVFGVFVNSLGKDSKRVRLDLRVMKFEYQSTIDLIPLLSSLEMHCEHTIDSCASLIHKCAITLADLSVCTRYPSVLFYDVDGDAVVYPNLSSFRISSNVMAGPFVRAVSPVIVPFPNLKILLIRERYPFGDDVPFRGNHNTLEHVDIAIDSRTMVMLNKSRVFDSKYACLQRVILQEDDVSCDLSDVPEATMTDFLRKLTGTVLILGFMSDVAATSMAMAAPPIRGFEHIQYLDVRDTPLSLVQALKLLNVLPSLRKLRSSLNDLGPEFNDMDPANLPDHIVTTYCNTGAYLHTLVLNCLCSSNSMTIAGFIMLLALACPKLYRICLLQGDRTKYQAEIYNELRSGGPYSKYASQLKQFTNASDLLSSAEYSKGSSGVNQVVPVI